MFGSVGTRSRGGAAADTSAASLRCQRIMSIKKTRPSNRPGPFKGSGLECLLDLFDRVPDQDVLVNLIVPVVIDDRISIVIIMTDVHTDDD